MKNIFPALACAIISLALVASVAGARGDNAPVAMKTPVTNDTTLSAAQVIARVVQTYIDKNSQNVGLVDITDLDIQGVWALAQVSARSKDQDDVTVLLRKRRSTWKVLVLGTALYGTGKIYGVPKNLRKKWNL